MRGSPTYTWIFRAALAAIPLLFFLLLELGLRLGSYGPDLRLFHKVDWKGRQYYAINPEVVRRYFSDPDFGTYTSRDRFLAEKPVGTYRIFCLGASTTVGTPYLFNGAYSSLIRDRLETRFPNRRFEVVNLGITAVNSFTVAELSREVMNFEPDLIIVYMGHNEFYGAFGIGSTEYAGSPLLVRVYLKLQHLKTVQLLRDVMRAIVRSGGKRSADDRQLMEKMVADQHIRMASPKYEAARRYFRSNYEDLIRYAKGRGVDVLVSTLAGNLRSQPPFVSLHSESLPHDSREAWQHHFNQATAAMDAGNLEVAIDEVRNALALDGERADAHFLLARCFLASGDTAAALDEFVLARDHDALRFRASSDFSQIVRDLSAHHGVPLVDMEEVFLRYAEAGIPGSDLFWEHVHPTLDGYFLMADAFVRAMSENELAASREEWARTTDRPERFYRQWAGLTDFDLKVAELRIGLMKSRWPFRAEPITFSFDPKTLEDKAAWDYLRRLNSWAVSHEALAQAYRQEGRLDRAAEHYWAVAKTLPYDSRYFVVAADLFARDRQFERAAEAYRYVLRIDDSPEIHAKFGMLIYQLREFTEAIEHLERAAKSPPSAIPREMRAHVHTLLATAYLNEKNLTMAQEHFNDLLRLAPHAPQARALDAAIRQFRARAD